MKNFTRAFCVRGDQAGQAGELIRFVASTSGLARDGLVIEAAGWKLDNYRKNPVVLWAHDYWGQHLPIGRAETVEVQSGQDGASLVADIRFDQSDPFARQIEQKYRDGYLNAVSVGWDTLAFKPSKAGESPTITEAELLDISGVPVPGDPDALMEREYRALKMLFDGRQNEPNVEDPWVELATEMVELFLPGSDDAERLKRYNALLPKYRRLGKTPPEFMAAEALDKLSLDEVRGLFLEGEEKFLADEKRAGAVLSARNADDLSQAVTLIQGVLERAAKEANAEGHAANEQRDEDPSPAIKQILDKLNTIK